MRRFPPVVLLCLLVGACAEPDTASPKIVIFFAHDSALIDGPARNLVSGAAKRAVSDPSALVTVAGYAAANGDTDADEELAGKRADVVAGLLEEDGVSASRISVVPRAPNNENPPVASRRVEITVGGS